MCVDESNSNKRDHSKGLGDSVPLLEPTMLINFVACSGGMNGHRAPHHRVR